MDSNDRRAEIFRVQYIKAKDFKVISLSSGRQIMLNAASDFLDMPRLSHIGFEENKESNFVVKKFQATCSDTCSYNRLFFDQICRIPVVLKIQYINGICKYVGYCDRPIYLSSMNGGSPAAINLYFTRKDSSFSPVFESF